MEVDESTTEIKTETPLKNQDLSFLQQSLGALLCDYGWYLLFGCVALYLLVQQLSKRRAERHGSGPGDVHDPSAVVERQAALEAARRRMQEKLDSKAEQFKEKQKQLEEEKRRQKIKMWESMQEGRSYKGNPKLLHNTEEASSTTVLKPKTKKPLRDSGFNALTGEGGGSCTWRPGRRGPSAGG
ncbi:selenoprotein S isoform X2 [Lepisosteus oculatus]|uniref:selenoprotein S isoform X2 n=1 Tax=Lepisosteus oculatus TaxID=7918 RepID=UPI003717F81C